MKALFVSDFGFDVLAQSLLSGLVECGMQVTDYPYNPVFHGEVETWDSAYLKFFLEADLPGWLPQVEDANDLGRYLMSLAPQGSQAQYTLMPAVQPVTEDGILRLLSDGAFEFVVLVVGYIRCRQAVVALARLADRARMPPIVLVDFSKEADAIRWDLAKAFGASVVFKNLVTQSDPQIIPLPLSSPLAGKGYAFLRGMLGERFGPDEPKKYDVHCNLSPTYPLRQVLSDELDRLCRQNGWRRALPGPYGENLLGVHESKVAFTMRGSELDTLHYWEIPSFQTAMFCDGTMGVIHPNPFINKETAVFYDPKDLSGLRALLELYLRDDGERIALASAGQHHCARYHSNRARAGYFLDIIKTRFADRKRIA
jgi:hypothetical protein